jgi:endonuclease G|tara:strand:+ start:13630 stop:14397 length:768 start_codon:yes stop_codon:yes gene_type:complete
MKFFQNVCLIFIYIFITGCNTDRSDLPSLQNFNYLPTSTTGQIVSHNFFTLSYSEKHEQAEWVAYHLKKNNLKIIVPRLNNFKIDKLITTGSSKLSDYKKSGYDRGHLAPSRDMSFSRIASNESFYLSNISPQDKSFNRGIWKKLESLVRDWAIEYGDIFVVTGGVLNSSNITIGKEEVSVPMFFYKIILVYDGLDTKTIAFVMPNEKSTEKLSNYVYSVDYLEDLTGIDFFPELPDNIEEDIEKKSILNQWSWD